MSAFSNFAENKLIDWFFRGQAIGVTGASAAAGTGPANLYVALLTAAPSDTGGGTEVTGGGYVRQAVVSSLANWAATSIPGNTSASAGTDGTTSNNVAITYAAPTASAYSAPVTHAAVYDAVSGGNMLFWSILGAPKTVNQNDAAPSFIAGSLTFQIDN